MSKNCKNFEKIWIVEKSVCISYINRFTGTRCGYVSVSSSHPFYGAHYSDTEIPILGSSLVDKITVHGGLTFSGKLDIPESLKKFKGFELNKLWWFGFDCNHSGDAGDERLVTDEKTRKIMDCLKRYGVDFIHTEESDPKRTLKTLAYVALHCDNLALELSKYFRNSIDFIVSDN